MVLLFWPCLVCFGGFVTGSGWSTLGTDLVGAKKCLWEAEGRRTGQCCRTHRLKARSFGDDCSGPCCSVGRLMSFDGCLLPLETPLYLESHRCSIDLVTCLIVGLTTDCS